MRYYNIHTHHKLLETNVISIHNLTQSETLSVSTEYPHSIFLSAGIHPWNIDDHNTYISLIKRLIAARKIVAIGEAGLDKMIDTPLHLQIDIFRQQIELAEDNKLPLIIHCVKAWDELIQLHKEYKPAKPWIIHGYRGGKQQAEQLKGFGFYFSIGEYYSAETLPVIYPSRIFIETDDSNILTKDVYANIAKDLNCTLTDLQANIEQNVSSAFDLRNI